MFPQIVVLGLGSNRAWNNLEPAALVAGAAKALRSLLGNVRLSPLYVTRPQYVTDQSDFVNAAAAGEYNGAPHELLAAVQAIEALYGRDRARERRWGERSLDIDILLFGDELIHGTGVLEIPHPRLTERTFALRPLLDLFPDAREPGTGRRYDVILAELKEGGIELYHDG